MTKYYNPQRARNLFNPSSKKPFTISRSAIDLYLRCQRCFYLDRRLGTSTPPSFPFTLNSAVDTLLKREFDIFRELQLPHPLMTYHGINCVPYHHAELERWRDSLHGGIECLHHGTNLTIKGSVDDIWIDTNDQLHVVDYKATAKSGDVTLDAPWQEGYRKQVELYTWLFRRNGFRVSDTAYFVYCNADATKTAFDRKLEFNMNILPYHGTDSWVDNVVLAIHTCLTSDRMPERGKDCDFCAYFEQRALHEGTFVNKDRSS